MKNRTIHYIRATVAAGSFLALMLIGIPLTDEYFEHRSSESAVGRMRIEATALGHAASIAGRAWKRGSQELEELSRRSTTADSVARARDEFVKMAREAGCHIRLINASDPEVRPWSGNGDDPFAAANRVGRVDRANRLELHTTRLSLTVVGALDEVQELSRQIASKRFLSVTDYVAIQPTGTTGDSVQMELRIRLFGLVDGARNVSPTPAASALTRVR